MTLLRVIRELKSQEKLSSPMLERQTGAPENHHPPELKPMSRNFQRIECWGRDMECVTDEMLIVDKVES